MTHYVYYSYEEWGRGYIGSRSTKKSLDNDSAYLGSFRDKTFRPTQKIVLMEFDSGKEAREAEVLLHDFFNVAVNPHFANKAKQTSVGFSTEGTIGPWANKQRSMKDRTAMRKKGKKSSLGMKGKKQCPETIARRQQTNKQKTEAEKMAWRKRLSEAAKKQWANPESRRTIIESQQRGGSK